MQQVQNNRNISTSGDATTSHPTNGPDILEMVHRYVNVPSGTPLNLQHSVKYIQFQINQHRCTKKELDHLKKKEEKRAAREKQQEMQLFVKEKISSILAPICKKMEVLIQQGMQTKYFLSPHFICQLMIFTKPCIILAQF